MWVWHGRCCIKDTGSLLTFSTRKNFNLFPRFVCIPIFQNEHFIFIRTKSQHCLPLSLANWRIGVEIWLMWPCRQSLGRSIVPLAMYLFQFPCKLMKEKGRVDLKRPIYSSFFWLFNFWWVKRTSRKIIGKHHCSKLNILWLLFST